MPPSLFADKPIRRPRAPVDEAAATRHMDKDHLFAAGRQASGITTPFDGPPPPWREAAPGPHGFVQVAGESFYQSTLQELSTLFDVAGREQRNFAVRLTPDPTNQYDRNAVAVQTEDGMTIGHLPRHIARTYQPVLLAQPGVVRCWARLTGGAIEGKKSIGVVLDFIDVDELKQAHARMRRRMPDHNGAPNPAINFKQRAERDVSELLGIVKGLLADGVVNDEELTYLTQWGAAHHDARYRWPASLIYSRLQNYFADGHIDDDERRDLADLMSGIVGGTVSMVTGYSGATSIPLDDPPPLICWVDEVYVLTGRFAYGSRETCEREIQDRGGRVEKNVTRKTSFLVLGTFGSDDWVHSSYGRKIERACELRNSGFALRIVNEDHWANALGRTASV